MAITLTVTGVDGPHLKDDPDGSATIECGVGLRATATGEGSADWVSATVRYLAGVRGDPPVDSIRLATSELHDSWGASTIDADSTQSSHWMFEAAFPFGATIEYEYRPADTKRVARATAQFHCGPVVASDATAPSVRALQAIPVGGALEPGGEIDVAFEAHSPVGIWQSFVVLDGACEVEQLFAERLQQTVTRAIRLAIPSTCALGSSVAVTAYVLDAGLREHGRTLANAIPVVDVTPPSLTPVLISPLTPGQTSPLEGTFFPGDTIRVRFGATDNHRVTWLVWEIAAFGFRDSIAVPPNGVEPLVMIPIGSGWSGPFGLRVIARDFSGLESAQQSLPGEMQVLPTANATMLADTIQWDLTDLIVDAQRDRIYVLQMLPHRVAAYSLATLDLVGTASLTAAPRDMDITPGGDSLVVAVAGSGTLGIIDLRQATFSAVEIPLTLDPALSQYPAGVVALADGRVLVALNSFQGLVGNRMHEIDLGTGAQRARPDVSADGLIRGSGMERSRDGRRVVIQSAHGARVFDLATDTFGSEVAPLSFANVSVDATGSRIAMGLDVHDGDLSLLRTVDALAGEELTSAEISPAGAFLVHAWRHRGIMWSGTADGRVEYRLTIPYPVTQMHFTPDGRVLVAAGSFPGGQQSVLLRYDLP